MMPTDESLNVEILFYCHPKVLSKSYLTFSASLLLSSSVATYFFPSLFLILYSMLTMHAFIVCTLGADFIG
jgi:hypothetical protein